MHIITGNWLVWIKVDFLIRLIAAVVIFKRFEDKMEMKKLLFSSIETQSVCGCMALNMIKIIDLIIPSPSVTKIISFLKIINFFINI